LFRVLWFDDGTELIEVLEVRVALRDVSTMKIRIIALPDRIDLAYLNDIFCAVLRWSGQMGYILSGSTDKS